MPIAVAPQAAGDLIPVKAGGPLPGTRLENFRLVAGGWSATIVDDEGVYNADKYLDAAKGIAQKYRMARSMITMLPDPEDETRCEIFAQRHPPIRETVLWAGPQSVDGPGGRAQFAVYADGEPLYYPIYRRGWGVYHAAFFGSTGSGKSHSACLALVIDRHAHYLDAQGQPRGMVASFLIDPQRGQTFTAFRGELAAPAAETLEEATLLVEALDREAWRRNGYLSYEVKWHDPKRDITRTGRDWWDPMVDGPLLTLTFDEAHLLLSDSKFAAKLTAGARMWRKVGIQVRLITQVSLLSDLGGSTALRDMLTGGFVWLGRSNNGLNGQLALNGRMNVDARAIPAGLDGAAVILTPDDPKGMLARTCWQPDWYDALYDLDNQPIGYPAEIPPETWDAFGDEFADWCDHKRSNPLQPWIPPQREQIRVAAKADPKCRDAVLAVLTAAARDAQRDGSPALLDMNGIAERLIADGHAFKVDTIRKVLKTLTKGEPGDDTSPPVQEHPGREFSLTDDALAALDESRELVAA
jgi:hypothetical protein